MAPTEEDLQKQRDEIERLRKEESQVDVQQRNSVAERSREIEKQRLDRESARVKKRLEGKRQQAQAATGTAAPTPPPAAPTGQQGGGQGGAQRPTPTDQE